MEHTPAFKPGESITFRATAAVTGGKVVEVSGPYTVKHAVDGSAKAIGVAAFDAAAGEDVTVLIGGVHPLTANGAVTAGDQLGAAANGDVKTVTTGVVLAVAMQTAATGAPVEALWVRS